VNVTDDLTSTGIVGVMGSGLIGTDPYEENAWSGSSRFFFEECQRQNWLRRAFGVDAPAPLRYPLMLRNFSFDRELWRQQFYLDTTYYGVLSRRIAAGLRADESANPVLQLGGIYNLRPHIGSRKLYSYHDGNLAQHRLSPQFPAKVSPRRVARALAYERAVCDGIDMIFTMSDYLRDSFINDFGVAPQRVVTVGAGINLERLPEPPAGKDYDTKKLLFLGSDFERKGGKELLRAFKRIRDVYPNAELNIVGPRQLDLPAGFSAGVNYLGFLSKKDPLQRARLDALFAASSLFVLPSRYEPFGIAPLEAMAYGIPAVLTNKWAFPEMVRPGVSGELVKLGDDADLADKVIDLLREPDRLQRMGQAARQIVLERFTWSTVVNKMRLATANA
jgi:glycosyltransferase involved in cell wall biosynthesis